MRFKDKVVLVTGGSRNTGLGIAALLIREGAKVCINDISDKSTIAGGEALKAMGLDNFIEVPADISKPEQVEKMFGTIREKYGKIDILVNNAANLGIGYSFEELPPEKFLSVLSVNLLGTFMVSQQAVKMMLGQGSGGIIVNIGSYVSTKAIRNRTAYVTSKGGLDALTRAMAIDLAPKGIRVNMVAPGHIYTDRWDGVSDETRFRRHLNIPLGIASTADDIAEAVAFLASDASKNICGERLVVDGGCSAQILPYDVDI